MCQNITITSDSESDLDDLMLLSDWDDASSSEEDYDNDNEAIIIESGHSDNNSSSNIKNNIETVAKDVECVQKLRRVNYMLTLEDADFAFRFRMSKAAVNCLLAEIMPNVRVTSSRNHGVSPLHQLLLTLRFYALGSMLAPIAEYVGVAKSTASRIVRDISIAIAKLEDTHILYPTQGAEKFYAITGFPQVLGVIDCTHIRIQSQCNLIGEEYRNLNGYLSLNVQAVCDADLKFMNVDASWHGSTDDASIFDNSLLKEHCVAGMFGGRFLLGDSAYPNRSYLLTPILNPTTEAENKYNEAHEKTRYTIVRTFEAWKRRFPIVGLTLRLSLTVTQAIIIATAILHNISRDYELEDIPPEVELPTEAPNDYIAQQFVDEDVLLRTDLINKYFTM